MLSRLIQYFRLKFGRKRPNKRHPLYNAQDPRELARRRSNRIYLKNLKAHQKAENRKQD
jgi:hypothetical protein